MRFQGAPQSEAQPRNRSPQIMWGPLKAHNLTATFTCHKWAKGATMKTLQWWAAQVTWLCKRLRCFHSNSNSIIINSNNLNPKWLKERPCLQRRLPITLPMHMTTTICCLMKRSILSLFRLWHLQILLNPRSIWLTQLMKVDLERVLQIPELRVLLHQTLRWRDIISNSSNKWHLHTMWSRAEACKANNNTYLCRLITNSSSNLLP